MNPRVATVLIGTELARGHLTDSNQPHISRELESVGIEVSSIHIVEDDVEFLSSLLQWLAPQVDYVLTVGGLGPTPDDITMAGVARAFGLQLADEHPSTAAEYAAMSGSETRLNRLRHRPVGAEVITTSEGPVVRIANVFSLPGLPRLVEARLPAVLKRLRGGEIQSQTIRIIGPQSVSARLLEDALRAYPSVSIGCYPSPDGLETVIELVGDVRDDVEACLQLILSELKTLGIRVR